jgi:cell division protein ZapA
MSEISLKVEIAGGSYPLKLEAKEVSNIKQAVELINKKISEFENKFGIKDKKDVLAMVSLQLVSELVNDRNTAENELSTLKLILNDVSEQLRQHQINIKNAEG